MGLSRYKKFMDEAYEYGFFEEVEEVMGNDYGNVFYASWFGSEEEFEKWRKEKMSSLPRWIRESKNVYHFNNILYKLSANVKDLYKKKELEAVVNTVRRRQGLPEFKIIYDK